MHPNLVNVSVRLETHTLELIDQLVMHARRERIRANPKYDTRPYSRSDLIRQAITAGLHVLTGDTPPKILEPQPCQPGPIPLPVISADQATA